MFQKVTNHSDSNFPKTTMLHFCCYQVSVNGSNEHPIFKHLKAALPLPQVGPPWPNKTGRHREKERRRVQDTWFGEDEDTEA